MFKLKQRSELISILPMLIAVDSVRGLAAQSAKKILSVDVFTTQLLSLTTLHRIFTSRRGDKTGISTRSSSHAKQAQYLAYFKTLIIGAAHRIKMSFG